MADRDFEKLPATGQQPGYHKVVKTTSETSKTTHEEHESRGDASGRYEKRLVTSETREAKTSFSEVREPSALAIQLPAAWRSALPEKIRIRLRGVQPAGCADAEEFDGEYILDLLESRAEQCRWELTLSPKCHLYRIGLTAAPAAGQSVRLQAFFEGSEAAPRWSATVSSPPSSRVMLEFDSSSTANPCAGCVWPRTIEAEPIGGPPGRFRIPAEPTPEEIMLMQASSSSFCSTDRCHVCAASLVMAGKVADQDAAFQLPADHVGPHVCGSMRWRDLVDESITKFGGRSRYYTDQDGNTFPDEGGYFPEYKKYIWTETGTGRWQYMRGFAVIFDYCDGKTHPCIWDLYETGTVYGWDPATMKFVKDDERTKAAFPTHFIDASKPDSQPKDVTTVPAGSTTASTGRLKKKSAGCGRRFVVVDFPNFPGNAGEGWGEDITQLFTVTDSDGQISKYKHHFSMYREPNQADPSFTSDGLQKVE